MFNVSYETKHHFEIAPYRTLCKVLSKLDGEGLLTTYSKAFIISMLMKMFQIQLMYFMYQIIQ